MRNLITGSLCLLVFSTLAVADDDMTPFEKGLAHLQKCAKMVANPKYIDPNQTVDEIENARKHMETIVIGQDDALKELASMIAEIKSDVRDDPNRPRASAFFSGPTGVGKTESVYALLSALGAERDKLIRINFNELDGEHSTSQLKGTSAGYAGYKDKPALHPDNMAANKIKIVTDSGEEIYINVVLLDEIEKAPLSALRFLYTALDHGVGTLGDNTKVNFRNTVFIATSNLGAKEVGEIIALKEKRLDRSKMMSKEEADLSGRFDLKLRAEIDAGYKKARNVKFADMPEFPGRFDTFINFYHLEHKEYLGILAKQMAAMQTNIFKYSKRKVAVVLSPAAQEKLLTMGTNPEYGARNLKSAVKKFVTRPLGMLSITKQINSGQVVMADVNADGQIVWSIVAEGLTNVELAQAADAFYPGYNLLNASFEKPANEPTGETTTQEVATVHQLLTRGDDLSNKLGKKLFIEARLRAADWTGPGGAPAVGKFIKVNDNYYLIEKKNGGALFSIQEKASIPDFLKNSFPDDKIDKFDDEKVKALARELGWKE